MDCAQRVCDFDDEVKGLLGKLHIADNLAVNTKGATDGMAKPVEFAGFVNLAGSAAEPVDLGFVDPDAGDFGLRPGARLREAVPAFESIPFETIGLLLDEYRREIPAR